MQLNVVKKGNGETPLLVFHGIGQTGAECFGPLADRLADYCTTYLFDLPFHGESGIFFEDDRWESGRMPLSGQEWADYLDDFLKSAGIDRFSVAGFSLGGRFALATLAFFGSRVEHAFLIAPDGVVDQPVFRLATSTPLFRAVFKKVTRHPRVLLNVADVLSRAGLIHASLLKILHFLASGGKFSETVYRSWTNFRKLGFQLLADRPDAPVTMRNVYVFLGSYDRLVQKKDVNPLVERLPESNFICLRAGHGSLVRQAVPEILRITLTDRK